MKILLSNPRKMSSPLYRNKKGTSDRQCNCHSWKQHWINFSRKKWPAKCVVLGCNNAAKLGAHITKQGERKEYIIPACESCNQSSSAFYLKQGACLVSANQSETCGKNDER